jgi:hypothetical protein
VRSSIICWIAEIEFEPLGGTAFIRRLQFFLGFIEPLFEGTKVNLERGKLLGLLVGKERAFVQLAGQPSGLRFLRRQREFGRLGGGSERLAAILCCVQCFAGFVEPCRQHLNFGLETENVIRLRVGEGRALVQLAGKLCGLRFLHRQRLRGRLGGDGQRSAAILRRIPRLARFVEPPHQRLNLGFETDDLVRLRLTKRRAVVQLAHELGDLRLLLGQRRLRFLTRNGQLLAAILCGVQGVVSLIQPPRQRLDFSLQTEDFISLRLGEGRTFIQLDDQLGELRIPLRQLPLGFFRRGSQRLAAIL